MNKRVFTLTEWFYWLIRVVFGAICTPPKAVANWATDRLNKSYYKTSPIPEGSNKQGKDKNDLQP